MTLPNFIIFGVAKAGTTSLYHYLDQHPQVFMSPVKETNFFAYEDMLAGTWMGGGDPPDLARFPIKTLEAYEAMFAGVSDEIAIGEASPRYFCSPSAPQRIHECIPDVKLVACLRNPAERAFSGLLMRVRKGRAEMKAGERLTPESHHVMEGYYHRWLKKYFDLFPKHQIKIYLFEEFKKDPVKIVTDLYDFLGVDTNFLPDTSVRHNPSSVPKIRLLNRLFYNPTLINITKSVVPESLHGKLKQIQQLNQTATPKLPADLRSELLNLYHEDILRLEELIGRDLSIWLNGLSETSPLRQGNYQRN